MCFAMGMLRRAARRTSLLGVRRGGGRAHRRGNVRGGIAAEGVDEDVDGGLFVFFVRGVFCPAEFGEGHSCLYADGRFLVVYAFDEGSSENVVDVLAAKSESAVQRHVRCILYFAEVGDHLGEYMDTAVSDDLVLCDEAFEKEFEKPRDEPSRRGVVVVVVIVVFLFDLLGCTP